MTTTILDGRFTRVKSPRSRQYLIRAHRKFAQAIKEKKLTNLVFYRNFAEQRTFLPETPELQ